MKAFAIAAIVAALTFVGAPAPADAGVMEQLKSSKTLRVGYREDAPPFSYRNDIGEAAGYSVELCRQIAAGIGQLYGIKDISISYVPVTAGNRFDAVINGQVDLLCGATTQTLARRNLVSFSIPTFIDGASVLFRTDGPKNFAELAGQRIGVRANTTTERGLRRSLEREGIDAVVIAVDDHEAGLQLLAAGDLSAYFGDRAILAYMKLRSGVQDQLQLSKRFFSHEPYALALPRGDEDFRLAVDRVLSALYRTGKVGAVFKATFPNAQPTDMLKALYVINGLPE